MSKDKALLNRFGANLAESMGAGRAGTKGGAKEASPAANRNDGTTRLRSGAEIAVDRIIADPNQPRAEFAPEAITRLAESLKSHGQLQPIAVRWSDEAGRYVVVTGERRWRAAIEAGRASISALILEGPYTESQILEMQLVENALREDLKPIEQAGAFRALMDRNDWSALRLSEVLHLNCSSITRALALLELPEPVQTQIESGALPPSVGYEISKVPDADRQRDLADRVVRQGMSRSETIEAVRQASRSGTRSGKGRGRKARKKLAPRTFRTASARVTIELRKAGGVNAMLAAVHEVARLLEAELLAPGRDHEEAA